VPGSPASGDPGHFLWGCSGGASRPGHTSPRGAYCPRFPDGSAKKAAAKVEVGAEEVYKVVLLLKARCVGGLFFCAAASLAAQRDRACPLFLANRPVNRSRVARGQ